MVCIMHMFNYSLIKTKYPIQGDIKYQHDYYRQRATRAHYNNTVSVGKITRSGVTQNKNPFIWDQQKRHPE